MEKQHFNLTLSLKQLALRRVAINLWSEVDILSLIKSFRCQSRTDFNTIRQWQELIENKVKEKVPLLVLPCHLIEDMIDIMKPIGPEILKWRMHYESVISHSCPTLNILKQLCWSSLGTVDYKKTAEVLIRQGKIDLTSCYRLACLFCFEDDIGTIWGKLSEETKRLFYDDVTPLRIKEPELVIFWTYLFKGEVSKLGCLINKNRWQCTLYQFAFESAALSGNKVATEYFFKKLTFEERQVSLPRAAQLVLTKGSPGFFRLPYDFPREKFCDVIFYLLSQMEVEEQEQVFRKLPNGILRYVIDWPFQDFFMKLAELMWSKNFLCAVQYTNLMRIFARNHTMTRYNYNKLFSELFLNAPSSYRDYFIYNYHKYRMCIRDLFYTHNIEMIKLVLKNVDDEVRAGFIISNTGYNLCVKFIEEERWDSLELFITECRLSSKNKEFIKNTFKRYLRRSCDMHQEKPSIEKFFQFIDNVVVNSDNKRIIDAEKEE